MARLQSLNPLPPLVIVAVLLLGHIPLTAYQKGGGIVTFFIGPSTVALAVPLYRHLPKLRANLVPILTSVLVGSVTGVLSAVLLARLLGATPRVALSLAAKSTTAPIAYGITEKLGGNTSLVVFAVVVTGIVGGILGPEFLKLLGITSKIATGVAIGTASHVGGTSRAVQVGDVEGSMSGAAIAVAGLCTAVTAPFLLWWLN